MREYITKQDVEDARNNVKVEFGPIGEDVYLRTYSRTKVDGSQEDWYETCARVVNGNLSFVPEDFIEKDEAQKLYHMMLRMEILPGGRHLWACGTSFPFLSNCFSADYTEKFDEHFEFTFMRLMEGGGVGANYSTLFVNSREGNKPWVPKCKVNVHIVCQPDHRDYTSKVDIGGGESIPFVDLLSQKYSYEWDAINGDLGIYLRVDDSREGWCEALSRLLLAHVEGAGEIDLVFDVSNIRHKGAILKGFGGRASGPEALMLLLKRVSELLNKRMGQPVTGMDIMLIDHFIAMAVVSGGVRRSARMSLKYWKDSDIMDFINCKKPDSSGRSNHWTTNISVVIDNAFFRALKRNDPKAISVYEAVINGILTNGEPGFINASKCLEGEVVTAEFFSTNPCGEIPFVRYPDMQAFDVCCLGHVNLARATNPFESFRLMTRFLIRATFAPVADKRQRENVERNRRIGVGFLGYHTWLVEHGVKYSDGYTKESVVRFFRDARNLIEDEARKYCKQLRIPECIKKTTIAPTGTTGQLAGCTTGLQPVFSKFFIRRVRTNDNDPILEKLVEEGRKVEKDMYASNTMVVEYLCVDPLYEQARNSVRKWGYTGQQADEMAMDLVEDQTEIALEDFLETQAMLQKEYVDNAISITVNVDPKRYTSDDLKQTLRHYLPRIKGLTVFPETSMPQSPYQRLSPDEFLELKEKGFLIEFNQGETECSVNGCPIR